MISKTRRIMLAAFGFAFAVSLVWIVSSVEARSPQLVFQAQGDIADAECLACHETPGQTHQLPSGELLYISVDPETHAGSAHGQADIKCVQCHTDISGYPHPGYEASTRREYTLEQYPICQSCHTEPYEAKTNDAHSEAIERGNLEAAVCADCHGAHDITSLSEPRSRIPQTCERCHSQIFNQYKVSVHGADLLGAGNPDVPSCVECHNAHNVQGPTNTQFLLFSPQICARCHENSELMSRYGINTQVFNTYVADFHGSTVNIFQNVTPGQRPNQAVCADCHGVHNIMRVDDPGSLRENLLPVCQRCHPSATANFPAAWLSHYPPSPEHAPLVFYARLFYTILIPGLIGGMAIFVIGDISRRFTNRRRKNQHE